MRPFALAMLTAVVLCGVASTAQTTDLPMGTWKLNLAKSKYNPGPLPKSETLRWQVSQGTFKFSADTVEAQGQTTHMEAITNADGRDYSLKGFPNTTRSTKRIDAQVWVVTVKVNGKVTVTRREALSADGKTLTVTATGTDEGRPVNNVSVFEKQ
jgi:hypothetical protein